MISSTVLRDTAARRAIPAKAHRGWSYLSSSGLFAVCCPSARSAASIPIHLLTSQVNFSRASLSVAAVTPSRSSASLGVTANQPPQALFMSRGLTSETITQCLFVIFHIVTDIVWVFIRNYNDKSTSALALWYPIVVEPLEALANHGYLLSWLVSK